MRVLRLAATLTLFAGAGFPQAISVCAAASDLADQTVVRVRGIVDYNEDHGIYTLLSEDSCTPLGKTKILISAIPPANDKPSPSGDMLSRLEEASRTKKPVVVYGEIRRNRWWTLGSLAELLRLHDLADYLLERPLAPEDLFPVSLVAWWAESPPPPVEQEVQETRDRKQSGRPFSAAPKR